MRKDFSLLLERGLAGVPEGPAPPGCLDEMAGKQRGAPLLTSTPRRVEGKFSPLNAVMWAARLQAQRAHRAGCVDGALSLPEVLET